MTDDSKTVIIVASALPPGIAANTIAYLALTLGQRMEQRLRPDVPDSSGTMHAGMAEVVLPILQAPGDRLKQLHTSARVVEGMLVIGFSNAAQSSPTYAAYTSKLATTPLEELHFLGLALHGPKKAVNKLTGNLPLLK
ncbi:MAG: DUF2000 domain-containing protein [Chloroflexaceae bacterium]|jgi:hypothetical protein|nr:DUF2000 domain-containing protein [Chloroflexaceae bacterium]